MTSFSDFGLAAPLLKALAAEGYTQPTPIQAQAIPHVVAGRDLLGIAQTGTGKTAAFALPTLHRLAGAGPRPAPRRGCRALILSPTRELASQIADSFRTYGRHLRLSVGVVFGGVPIGKQERMMAGGLDILVATPGRLLDLIDRRAMTLADVEIFVLDEADQMLDLGFIHALKRIVTLVPKKRQSLFFSATMPTTIAGLAGDLLADPVKVSVAPVATTAERVDQRVVFVDSAHKQALLAHVLSDPAIDRVLVFTRTKHGADRVVRHLEAANIPAFAIHGNKSQGQRERALGAFRNGSCRVLVATDIAARGIDVEGVSHVVNFDLPNVPESYVHRIGRTARAGAEGIAISFCNGEERAYLRDIERLTRLKVPVMPLPEGLAAMAARAPKPAEPARQPQGRPDGRLGPRGKARPAQGRSGERPQGERAAQGQRSAQGERNAQGERAGQGGKPHRGKASEPRAAEGQRSGSARPGRGPAHPPAKSGRDDRRREERGGGVWRNW